MVCQPHSLCTHTVELAAALPSATLQSDFGGRGITDHFVSLMNERGYAFRGASELEILRDMKVTQASSLLR